MFRGQLLLCPKQIKRRRSSRPALLEVEVDGGTRCLSFTAPLSKNKVDLSAALPSTSCKGINGQTPVFTHPRPAFLFRGQLLLSKQIKRRRSSRPALLKVEVDGGACGLSFTAQLSKKKVDLSATLPSTSGKGITDQTPISTHPRPAFLFRGRLVFYQHEKREKTAVISPGSA